MYFPYSERVNAKAVLMEGIIHVKSATASEMLRILSEKKRRAFMPNTRAQTHRAGRS